MTTIQESAVVNPDKLMSFVLSTRCRTCNQLASAAAAVFGVAVEDRTEIPCSRRSPHSLVSASVVAVHYVVARDLAVRVSRQRSR